MSDVAVENLFIVVRAFIVGGVLFICPLITRKGLLFGVYIGEDEASGAAAAALKGKWYRASLAVTAVSLAAGLAVSNVSGHLRGTATLVSLIAILGAALYVRMHSVTRATTWSVAESPPRVSVAPIELGEPRGTLFARVSLAACLLGGLALVAHAAWLYPDVPAQVRTCFGLSGNPDAWSQKSFGTVMVPSVLGLVLSTGFALMAILITGAKRSIRGGHGGGSVEAQADFRWAMTRTYAGAALCTLIFLGLVSVQSVRLALGEIESWGLSLLFVSLPILIFMAASLLQILAVHGQGGALRETATKDTPLSEGLADDSHWVWGVLYVNRADPSLIVESRFGFGYTLNYGHLVSVVLTAVFSVLLLGLIAVAISGP